MTPLPNKPWPDLSRQERIAKVRHLDTLALSRTDQATRLGLTLTALSQFCSSNGLTASNDNAHMPWRTLSQEEKRAAVAAMLDDEDMSLREIAEEMGTTIGAVRSYCVREGLVTPTRKVRVDGPPMIPVPAVPESTWDTLGREPVSLMELGDYHCRWPVHGGFCGCTVSVGSYCETHYAMSRGKRNAN